MGKELRMHKLEKEIKEALSKRGIHPEKVEEGMYRRTQYHPKKVEVWNDLNGPFDLYIVDSYKWLTKYRKRISKIVSKYGFSYKGIFKLWSDTGYFLIYERWEQEVK